MKPDYYVWLGDAAYVDRMIFPNIWLPETDPNKITMKFNYTKYDPDYAAFRQSGAIIYGVYDDHDYNQNNGGKEHPYKQLI